VIEMAGASIGKKRNNEEMSIGENIAMAIITGGGLAAIGFICWAIDSIGKMI